MNRWLLGLALAFTLAAAGCGGARDYSTLQLVPVTGKITLDGAPLAGAQVHFQGSDGLGATGVTDSGGNYTLNYDSEQAGSPPGAKTVKITTAGAEEEGADPDNAVGEKVPARYNRQTTLKADVSATNSTFNFDLKTKP